MKRKWKPWLLRTWRRQVRPILIVVLVVSSLRSAVADWNDVPTGSMKPTILEGDRIFVNKLAYDLKVPFTSWRLAVWGEPRRGDVVVLFSPADGTRLVKRVVGVPGDRIALRANRLFVNEAPATYQPLDRETINQIDRVERPGHQFAREGLAGRPHPIMLTPGRPALRSFGPITVPPGQYFIMGDNRDASFDSRFFGCVDRSRIAGEATGVVLSLDPGKSYRPRWDRFFRSLP